MQINTISVVVGGTLCNASCPFCVARMTPSVGVPERAPENPNWSNFPCAIQYAENAGASTVLLTSKGEPTLAPQHITECLDRLLTSKIAFREMQTNGIVLAMHSKYEPDSPCGVLLHRWRELGLNTIALSIVSPHDWKNQEVYTPHGLYPPLVKTIKFLRGFGFGVRLSCIMVKGYTDSIEKVKQLLSFAKDNDAFQVTLIPVTKPGQSEDPEAFQYVGEHELPRFSVSLRDFFDTEGNRLLVLPHGAIIYDYQGQNVCVSNCLTETTDPMKIRQLIYFTHDGSLRYSWQHPGARIL